MRNYLLLIYLTATMLSLPLSYISSACDQNSRPIVYPIKTTVASAIIKEYVETNFSFTGEVECTILNIGVNDIYLVETGSEKHILRLSRTDKSQSLTESAFLFELEWLEFLNLHHVPVAHPIPRSDKKLFGVIKAPEGLRFATLFSFAEGTPDMDARRAFMLGKSLADLHTTSDLFVTTLTRDPLDIKQLVEIPLHAIRNTLKESWKEELLLLENEAEKLMAKMSTIDKKMELTVLLQVIFMVITNISTIKMK